MPHKMFLILSMRTLRGWKRLSNFPQIMCVWSDSNPIVNPNPHTKDCCASWDSKAQGCTRNNLFLVGGEVSTEMKGYLWAILIAIWHDCDFPVQDQGLISLYRISTQGRRCLHSDEHICVHKPGLSVCSWSSPCHWEMVWGEVPSMRSKLMKSLRFCMVPWKSTLPFIVTIIGLEPWHGDTEETMHELIYTDKLILYCVKSWRHHYELVYAICTLDTKILTFSLMFLKCNWDSDSMGTNMDSHCKGKRTFDSMKTAGQSTMCSPKSPGLESDRLI